MVFVVLFAFAALLIHIANKKNNNNQTYLRYIILVGLLLIIPASIRDLSVGTDISYYQNPLFKIALTSGNISQYYKNWRVLDVEYFYSFLLYCCAKLTKSINAWFFFEECLIVYPMLFAIWHYREKIQPEYTLIAYECLFYFDSYNIVRQMLAVVWGIIAFIMFEERKVFKCIIFLIIAVLFHKTAIILIPILALYYIYNSEKVSEIAKLCCSLILALLVIIFSMNYRKVLVAIVRFIPFLNVNRYVSVSYLERKTNIPILYLVIWIFCYVILMILRKGFSNDNFIRWNLVLLIISIVSIGFYSMSNTANRILLYTQIFTIFSCGYTSKLFRKTEKSQKIYLSIYYISLSAVWIYLNYIQGVGEVFPYKTIL